MSGTVYSENRSQYYNGSHDISILAEAASRENSMPPKDISQTGSPERPENEKHEQAAEAAQISRPKSPVQSVPLPAKPHEEPTNQQISKLHVQSPPNSTPGSAAPSGPASPSTAETSFSPRNASVPGSPPVGEQSQTQNSDISNTEQNSSRLQSPQPQSPIVNEDTLFQNRSSASSPVVPASNASSPQTNAEATTSTEKQPETQSQTQPPSQPRSQPQHQPQQQPQQQQSPNPESRSSVEPQQPQSEPVGRNPTPAFPNPAQQAPQTQQPSQQTESNKQDGQQQESQHFKQEQNSPQQLQQSQQPQQQPQQQQQQQLQQLQQPQPQQPPQHVMGKIGSTVPGDHHTCANCKTTETPLWRRGPNGQVSCNACGLYIKARNIHRPLTLKRTPLIKKVPITTAVGSCPGNGRCNGTGGSSSCAECPSYSNNSRRNRQENSDLPGGESSDGDTKDVSMISCQNCGTVNTPLWRRDVQGHIICNACGLYNRIHKDGRPAGMQSAIVKRRKRRSQSAGQYTDPTKANEKDKHNFAFSVQDPHQQPGTHTDQGGEHDIRAQYAPDQPQRLPPLSMLDKSGATAADGGNSCCSYINPTVPNASQQPHFCVNANQASGTQQTQQQPQSQQQQPQQAPVSHPQHPQHTRHSPQPFGYMPSAGMPPNYLPPMGQPMPYYGQAPIPSQQGVQQPISAIPQHLGPSQMQPSPYTSQPGTPHGVQATTAPLMPVPASQQRQATTSPPQQVSQIPQQQPASQPQSQQAQSAQTQQPPLVQAPPQQLPSQPQQQQNMSSQTTSSVDPTPPGPVSSVPAAKRPKKAQHGDSPLSVSHYLRGSSQDTKKEYSSAAQRQLSDKIADSRARLEDAEYQLGECDKALEDLNNA